MAKSINGGINRHNLSLPQHRGIASGGTIASGKRFEESERKVLSSGLRARPRVLRQYTSGEAAHKARSPKKGGPPIAAPSYPPVPVVDPRRSGGLKGGRL